MSKIVLYIILVFIGIYIVVPKYQLVPDSRTGIEREHSPSTGGVWRLNLLTGKLKSCFWVHGINQKIVETSEHTTTSSSSVPICVDIKPPESINE